MCVLLRGISGDNILSCEHSGVPDSLLIKVYCIYFDLCNLFFNVKDFDFCSVFVAHKLYNSPYKETDYLLI